MSQQQVGFAAETKDDVPTSEGNSIHLHGCRLSELGDTEHAPGPSGAANGSRARLAGAPSAAEAISQLQWDEAPAFNIDAETGMAVARTEPPLEALDENGICHVAVKVRPAVLYIECGSVCSSSPDSSSFQPPVPVIPEPLDDATSNRCVRT